MHLHIILLFLFKVTRSEFKINNTHSAFLDCKLLSKQIDLRKKNDFYIRMLTFGVFAGCSNCDYEIKDILYNTGFFMNMTFRSNVLYLMRALKIQVNKKSLYLSIITFKIFNISLVFQVKYVFTSNQFEFGIGISLLSPRITPSYIFSFAKY